MTGQRNQKPALIWEINITTQADATPNDSSSFEDWLDKSHQVVERWFFSLIAGDLRQQFGGN